VAGPTRASSPTLPFPLKVINDLTYSTTVKHLSSIDIRKIELGGPPQAEQRAIAACLDRETAKIDALIRKIQDAISRLKELRTAVIFAAVTGKIDVRGQVA
jgi:type I restriction enzyme S subunit